ncbi:hypothetical protein GH714_031625 [Hevea brasiliensis]|uniref:TPX2 C-terminal domain-containing protein n=1 Tax=Hevea brasiliensis TaxID=3981 RepID=A0A6A6LH62_HEVBR|nr:hypothetical protein GH714_031625 [Hevea brasiliensis]
MFKISYPGERYSWVSNQDSRNLKISENSNPNVSYSSPGAKPTNSPLIKSAKSQKTASKNPIINHNAVPYSPRNKIRERKFVVAKKNSRKGKVNSTSTVDCKCKEKFGGQVGISTIKRRRDKLLEQARNSVPESGMVMHLVKAFEQLRTIPDAKDSDKKEEEKIKEEKKKVTQWALPGLQILLLHCPSDLFLTSENLGLDPRLSVSSSSDSSQGSISSRTSNGGRRSRRNSSESCGTMGGRRWKKKQLKITCQKPFKLRTEQRGRMKEEEFMKKLQETMTEEDKQRIPIAQGLPWTTDEPECLIKPPVKENTRPIDLKLHSDIRAVERAEFDQQVAEKLSLIEQYKMERERQQKMVEEEELRRLRKELVPKAQPLPYFDRPFIPRR